MRSVEGESRFWPHAMSRICELSWLYGGHSGPSLIRVSPNMTLRGLAQGETTEMKKSSPIMIPTMWAEMPDLLGM